jgi:hypothetical protein
MNFEIPEDLLKNILLYLGTKPFQEVYQLITTLHQLKRVEIKKEDKNAGNNKN